MADSKMDNGMDKLVKYSVERTKCIKEASSKFIRQDYATNRVLAELHPKEIKTQVKAITVESHDTKTFVLTSEQEFPIFQEGQYITIEVPIEGVIYQRAYTISCSSKSISRQEISITIKKVEGGVVSNYFFSQVNIGDYFIIHGPSGFFTYQPLRDSHHVLAIASGSGIIPFKAMAEAIQNGILDFQLTILYSAKTKRDLLFQKFFDELTKKEKRIQVIYFLSEEEQEGYFSGLITKEVIQKYQQPEMSYFVCGPTELYESMNVILKELNIANRFIRHDCYDECQTGVLEESFEIRVFTDFKEKIVFGKGNETIMQTLEREGIIVPRRCGVGVCGYCRSKLLEGEVLTNDRYLRAADKKYHYIHLCASYPCSNLKIKLPK